METVHFRRGIDVHIVDDSRLFLLTDQSAQIIDNPVTAEVARLIDGVNTAADIVARLSRRLEPAAVFGELRRLDKAGHLVRGQHSADPVADYLEGCGPVADRFSSLVDQTPVTVASLADPEPGQLIAEALQRLGGRVRSAPALPPAGTPGLVVVLADDYLDDRLALFNRQRTAAGGRWVLARPWGQQIWIGPHFVPGTTGCWECLADRLRANRQVQRYLATKQGWAWPKARARGLLPGAEGVVAAALSRELIDLVCTAAGRLEGRLLTIDPATMVAETHHLVNQPQCPVSGDPALRRLRTSHVRLDSEPAQATDGGYRTCTAEATLARLSHHVSPFLGAVSKIESLDTDTEGITYSFSAGHNFAMVNDSLDLLRDNLRGQSGGKGRTEPQARASAICEALERFSGVWSPQVPAVRAAWDQASGRATHPRDVLLFSSQQYAHRDAWNADPEHRLHRVPEPFDDSRPIDFTPAWSLTRAEEVLVPAGLVWFGQPDLSDHFYAVTDSNGGAAGNTLSEAILQGLCEVFERDAVALWWYNRCARPGVDLDSFAEPYVDRLRDFYDAQGRNLWVLDLSTDLSMPTFAALSARDHEVEDVMLGFGSHPDPQIALLRALTELNQFLPFVARRDAGGSTIYHTKDPATLEWCRNVATAAEPWLRPAPGLPATRLADLTLDRLLPEPGRDVRGSSVALGEVVEHYVAELDSHGVETLVVNQTRPDIELHVVKVIAPSMRHFWRRNAPGRLYDVPVQLGWLERPLSEAELNPRNMFF